MRVELTWRPGLGGQRAALWEEAPRLVRRTRSRQAAVLHLRAAAATDDVFRRRDLRLRAAELILLHPD